MRKIRPAATIAAGAQTPASLKDAYRGDFVIGAAINNAQIMGRDSIGDSILEAQFSSITPENILKLRPARMRAVGLSGQKTEYIRDLARHTRDGRIRFEELADLPDEEVMARLTAVKGIGVWTVHMFLMFALRRHDVLPTGDLGIRNAIRHAYGLEAAPSPGEVEAMAERWHPFCTVASWYLWRSLEPNANL